MIFRRCFIRALHICSCAAVMRLNCINSDCPHQPCTIPLRPSLPCWMRCRCQGCEYWPTAQVDTSHRDHALRLLQSCCIDVTLFTVFTLSTCLSATAEVTPPTRALWHPQGVPDWQKDHKKKSKKKQDHQKRSKKKNFCWFINAFHHMFHSGTQRDLLPLWVMSSGPWKDSHPGQPVLTHWPFDFANLAGAFQIVACIASGILPSSLAGDSPQATLATA